MPEEAFLELPQRTAKPRETGLSNLVDNGYGLNHIEDVLSTCPPVIDIVKFGWASAYITPSIQEKVAYFSGNDIRCCPGGMMFEISYWQNKIDDLTAWMRNLGIDMVEVSNGSLPISEVEKREMISLYARLGFTVLSEVGSKDVTHVSPPQEWIEFIKADLDSGSWKVILEGRADASAGVYDSKGNIQVELIEAILDSGVPVDKLIFEAPHKRQMTWLIERLGTNVNIGNVPLGEVLNLETLRLGLRGDTVRHFHGERKS